MNIKIIVIGVLTVILIASCNKKEDNDNDCACGVEHPEVNLEWLKSRLELRLCSEVYSITFLRRDYITINDCPDTRDGIVIMFDCEGTKVCEWGGIYPGGHTCNMPSGFTFEYYDKFKKLIFTQKKSIQTMKRKLFRQQLIMKPK